MNDLRYLGPVPTHKPGNAAPRYGSDQTADKDWQYQFNSLGYRGEEVDFSASIRILVTGDSNTVGEGVPWEETWGARIESGVEESSPNETVSLLNVAQSGAPNDYIAREAIFAATQFKPTILVALFSGLARKENASPGDRIEHIGPWRNDGVSKAFYGQYTDEGGVLNYARNLLLLQYFCKSAEITLLWSIPESADPFGRTEAEHPLCKRYLSLVDRSSEVPCNLFQFDLGADGLHPGPEGHRKFSENLLSRL